jgi:preprotein translocase subunit SecF
MELLPVGRIYDFMGRRHLFMGISLIACILSLVMWVWPGAKLGTDFKGGTEIELDFEQPVEAGEIRGAITGGGFSDPEVIAVTDVPGRHRFMVRVEEVQVIAPETRAAIEQALCFGDGLPADRCPEAKQPNEVKFSPGGDKITVRYREPPDLERIRGQMAGIAQVSLRKTARNPNLVSPRDNKVEILLQGKGEQLMDVLRAKLGEAKVPAQPLRAEWIGPKAGAQLRDAAIKSILIALVFIMLYVAFRFDLRFAPGGVVALIHDALITVGGMIALGRELNLTTVAAVLTIIGYSINDTVVVYDRVRETLPKRRGATFVAVINEALSDMLSRTLLTNTMVLVSLLAFFVWGTGTLKDFALALIIGQIAGTYSSIYVALPLTEILDRRVFSKLAKAKPKPAAPAEQPAPGGAAL